MNRSYIRLLIANAFLILITTLNSIYSFFNSYTIILFLSLFLVFIYKYIGYERNNKRYQKDILIQIITYIIVYYMITYLIGFFSGFNKSGYNLSYLSIIKHTLPVILTIPIIELIRYIFVSKGSVYKSIIVLVVINLIMLDITLLINTYSYGILNFILLVLVPSISKNILLTYVTFKVGYKSTIVYRLLFELPIYILPIFPTFGVYIESLISFLFPITIIYFINNTFAKTEQEKVIGKKEIKIIPKIVVAIAFIILSTIIVLTTGVFKYFAVTIGSKSMVPNINKGDIVIVKKLNADEINQLKEKDILVFKHDNIIIIHRIIRIMEVSGEKYFYTKGDNNNAEDGYPIKESDVVGTYSLKIPYLGTITVALNEMMN